MVYWKDSDTEAQGSYTTLVASANKLTLLTLSESAEKQRTPLRTHTAVTVMGGKQHRESTGAVFQ